MSTPTQRGGNGFARAGNTHQPFTWNGAYGYEWVPETGLYHVGAREYDPAPHGGSNATQQELQAGIRTCISTHETTR